MKWIKRIFKNLSWLFNHPPTNIVSLASEKPCDYCGKTVTSFFDVSGVYCICTSCQKKAYDSMLKDKEMPRIPSIAKRPRMNYIPFMDADPDRILVSMIEFKDNIYVATQKGVYILKNDKFARLKFKESKDATQRYETVQE